MAETRPPSVRVRDLTKRYGAVEAVRGVSFEVAQGEIFGILGPNGAGKTSILECLLGLRSPDSGSIEIDGVDAVSVPRSRQGAGRRAGPDGLAAGQGHAPRGARTSSPRSTAITPPWTS